MHIIIIGAGEVGGYLAQILLEERHDVCIIEEDGTVARQLDDRLDAQVIQGTGVSREALFRAGIKRADLLLAVTQVDEVNLIAAMTAEKLAKACRTVARIRDPRYLYGTDAINPKDYGVDFLVGPVQGVAAQVVQVLRYSGAGQITEMAEGKLMLLELPVMPHSALVYATFAELEPELPTGSSIAAVLRQDGMHITSKDDRFQVGERIFVLSPPQSVDAFLELTGAGGHSVERVLLIGGGDIALHVARALERLRFSVTVIEKNAERAHRMAVRLARSIVLNADGTDPAMLAEQVSGGHDAVVVLLADDEKSLLTGMMCKHLGAEKVVARVDAREYAPIAHKLGLDALISPRRALADAILRFVRRGKISSTKMLGDHEGELIDFRIDEEAGERVIGRPLREITLPRNAALGAVVRDGEVVVPGDDNLTLCVGDHVFVVALRSALQDLEGLFD